MIEVRQLHAQFGAFALRDVTFTVPTGQYGVVMGRTGCGKTSLLECLCGLAPVRSGRIILHGRDVTRHKPSERGIGYVPQDAALFTTMTVRGQLGFALDIRRRPKDEIRIRVMELAALLGIEHLLDRLPEKLSGGEKQRVALGRALSARPAVLCLDEPLSALDDETREAMYQVLERVKVESGATIIHITHNAAEADRLADCRFRMSGGQIDEVAPPT